LLAGRKTIVAVRGENTKEEQDDYIVGFAKRKWGVMPNEKR
jgi:hypothetical protein